MEIPQIEWHLPTVANDWLKFVRVPTISLPLETRIYMYVARLVNLQTISYTSSNTIGASKKTKLNRFRAVSNLIPSICGAYVTV